MLNKKLLGSVSSLPQDDNFENVTLLLNGDGTNGGQNNTFVDSSTNNFTITRNGNTTQGSFSPYGDLWSAYLGANGNYFTSGTSSTLGFGTGDFTIEFFLFVDRFVDNQFLIDFRPSGNAGAQRIYFYLTTSGSLIYGFSGSNKITSANSVVGLGTWTHIAITRASGSTKVFVNGSQVGSTYSGSEDLGSSERFVIGTFGDAPGNSNANGGTINGNISNLRILKGTAQYTGTYTVPTANLTAITNTSVLTFQSNRYVDNSANAISITPSGSPSVQRFSPFEPSAPYSTSVIGGSGYFDGSGDYLTVPSNSALDFGTGDFTVEFWVYPTSLTFNIFLSAPQNVSTQIAYDNSGRNLYFYRDANIISGTAANSLIVNQWNHVVLSRSGTTLSLFSNGVRRGTTTYSSAISFSAVHIGQYDAGSYFTVGYLTNVRLVKGTAVYDPTQTTYTIPTAPLTAITNTSLLCNFTNASIADLAMQNNLETVGNAQVSTSVVKYGTGSLYFDGSGDYLKLPSSINLAFGSGSWTIEFWFYPLSSYGSGQGILAFSDDKDNLDYGSTSNTLRYYNGSTATTFTGVSITANTWQHIALVNNSGTVRVYVNGTQSTNSATGATSSSSRSLNILANTAGSALINAYIDDLRISRGIARYTASFTPPASALPTY